MALQTGVSRNDAPTADELELIFRPAADRAQSLIAELDLLAQKAGRETQATVRDPLVPAMRRVCEALTAPLRGKP